MRQQGVTVHSGQASSGHIFCRATGTTKAIVPGLLAPIIETC
ncbi:hypothetical protein J2X01_004131 [Arthrobacter ginsengisoli]|uniref:Uncharacterized protein n=1 Tax=Arthrobacter ginsengisoli TaxID=1356565 RepID=A0ABU1UHZ8_9MICC|nr:hypothetical protein [Arthrobacter ginsengisoli]